MYNVAPYIGETIGSCLSEELHKGTVELIVINDGSTDGSDRIAQDLLANYPHLLINDTHRGVSVARNTGLSHAKGEYIWFVDSDDYIEPTLVPDLIETVRSREYDVVTLTAEQVSQDGERLNILLTPQSDSACSAVWLRPRSYLATVWGHLFRRKPLLEGGISFKAGVVYEDELFIPQALACLPHGGHFRPGTPIYYYRQRPGSITQVAPTASRQFDRLTVATELAKWYESHTQYDIRHRISTLIWLGARSLSRTRDFAAMQQYIGILKKHPSLRKILHQDRACRPAQLLYTLLYLPTAPAARLLRFL